VASAGLICTQTRNIRLSHHPALFAFWGTSTARDPRSLGRINWLFWPHRDFAAVEPLFGDVRSDTHCNVPIRPRRQAALRRWADRNLQRKFAFGYRYRLSRVNAHVFWRLATL